MKTNNTMQSNQNRPDHLKSQNCLIWKSLKEAASFAGEGGYYFDDKKITFEEIDEASDRLATALLNRGYKSGDCLGLLSTNNFDWIITFFAASKIGVIIVALSITDRKSELIQKLNHSKTRGIISIAKFPERKLDYVDLFYEYRSLFPHLEDYIFSGDHPNSGVVEFSDMLATSVDHDTLETMKEQITPSTPVILIYTSGTTGTPKAATLNNESIIKAGEAHKSHINALSIDVVPLAMPLNHVSGLVNGLITNLLARSLSILVPTFSPGGFLLAAIKHGATIISGTPALFYTLTTNPYFSNLDRERIRLVISAAAPLEEELVSKLKVAFPFSKIMNRYGLTEASGGVAMSLGEGNSQGINDLVPLPGIEICIQDKKGVRVPYGEMGEICIKTNSLIPGYFNPCNPNHGICNEEGWLPTGDLGTLGPNGKLRVLGRLKEMYICYGYNVYPAEVENYLSKHPKVRQAAGIGIKAPVAGEVGKYFVVPKPGVELTRKEILDFCREGLADYKAPFQIVFFESLPLTRSGKVCKATLKEF